MLYGQDREALRRVYVEAWRKRTKGLPLSPLEHRVADVIAEHPEYHRLLDPDHLARDYPPESGAPNPFLHMGMHIALQEQVASGRPAGIVELQHALRREAASAHDVEHRMMDCLAEALWQAQRTGSPPDEAAYLDCLRKRIAG